MYSNCRFSGGFIAENSLLVKSYQTTVATTIIQSRIRSGRDNFLKSANVTPAYRIARIALFILYLTMCLNHPSLGTRIKNVTQGAEILSGSVVLEVKPKTDSKIQTTKLDVDPIRFVPTSIRATILWCRAMKSVIRLFVSMSNYLCTPV